MYGGCVLSPHSLLKKLMSRVQHLLSCMFLVLCSQIHSICFRRFLTLRCHSGAFRLPLVRQNSEFIEFLLVSYGIRAFQVPILVVALIMKRSFDHLVSDRFSPDGLIQLSEEISSRVRLVILSIVSVSVIVCIHWWVIGPVSFTRITVSQHVSGLIQAGLHGYRNGSKKLTSHHTSLSLNFSRLLLSLSLGRETSEGTG